MDDERITITLTATADVLRDLSDFAWERMHCRPGPEPQNHVVDITDHYYRWLPVYTALIRESEETSGNQCP